MVNQQAWRHVLQGVAGVESGRGPVPAGRGSDEALVRALYSEHAAPLLRYALHLTSGDQQRAEDIVQETLLRAWLHPEAIADRPARPWLFAVARNLAVAAFRARRPRPRSASRREPLSPGRFTPCGHSGWHWKNGGWRRERHGVPRYPASAGCLPAGSDRPR